MDAPGISTLGRWLEKAMKKKLFLLVVLGACGCDTMSHTEKGALGGAAVGTTAGALAGHALGSTPAGAAIGLVGGTLAGSLIGSAQDRREDRARAQAHAQAQAQAAQSYVSLEEVVGMTHQHFPEDVIIRQIDSTHSYYNLTVPELTYLRNHGVSDRVIGYMQGRRPPVVQHTRPLPAGSRVYVVEPEPPPVAVGIGFGTGWCGPHYYHRHRHCW
jgi:uncharacterized protein YcfJ